MPAVKCNTLAQSYAFSGSAWTTTDKLSSSSYCYKKGGNEYPHITIIDTGKGNNNVRKFHITTEVENSEVKINYFYNIGQGTLSYDALNNDRFPSQKVQTVNDHLGDLWDTGNPWHTTAVAFCNAIGATVVEEIETTGPQGVE